MGTETVTENQQVTEDVRQEEIEVDGDVDTTTTGGLGAKGGKNRR